MEQQEDVSPTASAAASMGAQATSKNDVLHQWTDGLQGTTYYRRGVWDGVTGWGDAKITAYHNLSWKPVKVVSQHPAAWHVSGKTSVNFYGEFDHYKCSGWWIFRSCGVVGKLTVTVITDYRLYGPYPQTFGAFNAYCIGVVSCPDWVKNSINI
jgi:hypothetical protein